MAHPFEKIFYKALQKSTAEENLVYADAKKILAKGYRFEEVLSVLTKLQKSLVDEKEEKLVGDAILDLTDEN
jgi:hypothetical protein